MIGHLFCIPDRQKHATKNRFKTLINLFNWSRQVSFLQKNSFSCRTWVKENPHFRNTYQNNTFNCSSRFKFWSQITIDAVRCTTQTLSLRVISALSRFNDYWLSFQTVVAWFPLSLLLLFSFPHFSSFFECSTLSTKLSFTADEHIYTQMISVDKKYSSLLQVTALSPENFPVTTHADL